LAEVLPVLIGRGLLDHDLLVVVRQLEDDVLVLLVQLQLVVGGYAFLRDGRSVGEDNIPDVSKGSFGSRETQAMTSDAADEDVGASQAREWRSQAHGGAVGERMGREVLLGGRTRIETARKESD
jgi:hypothetical protein